MCDYSLHHVASRPAKVGDQLTTRDFGTGTRGFAAAQDARDNGERPPRPDNASNAAIGGWCDALIGPDKERCLRQGGKVEVDTKSTRGHSGGS